MSEGLENAIGLVAVMAIFFGVVFFIDHCIRKSGK